MIAVRGCRGVEKPDTHIVHLRFRADGPAVTGSWTDKEVAESKFKREIGGYGSIPGVVITLSVQAAGHEETILKT
ncbi:hypothetical protein [Streptomyces sp. BA2]|uniref:hypothetical protein n=1 Tax=Streptomyces sp. BA2 TaxID=436595 RepID=UPI0013283275|nr:hypothetical protein [Streptomyces sp. BA2]MWA08166.1 hypothetical protein [Streptomyces sp. BA2]